MALQLLIPVVDATNNVTTTEFTGALARDLLVIAGAMALAVATGLTTRPEDCATRLRAALPVDAFVTERRKTLPARDCLLPPAATGGGTLESGISLRGGDGR